MIDQACYLLGFHKIKKPKGTSLQLNNQSPFLTENDNQIKNSKVLVCTELNYRINFIQFILNI